MEHNMMTTEDRLRFNGYMARAGYNIKSLADEIGVSRPTLSNKINGKSDFSRSEMERIAKTLNAPPGDIFFAG